MEIPPVCRNRPAKFLNEEEYRVLLKHPEETGWEELRRIEGPEGETACYWVEKGGDESFYVILPPKKKNAVSVRVAGELDTNTDIYRAGPAVNISLYPHPDWHYESESSGKIEAFNNVAEVRTIHQLYWNSPNRWLSLGSYDSYGYLPNWGLNHQVRALAGPLLYATGRVSPWFAKGNRGFENHLYASQYFGYEFVSPVQPDDPDSRSVEDTGIPVSSTRVQFKKRFGPVAIKAAGQVMQDLMTDASLPSPIKNTELIGQIGLAVEGTVWGIRLSAGLGGEVNWARERPAGVDQTIFRLTQTFGQGMIEF